MAPGIPLLLGACCFTSMAALRVCDTLLPVLAADFSVTLGQAARVIFVFAVAYGVFQLFFGTLGDRYGKLRIIALGALLLRAVRGDPAPARAPRGSRPALRDIVAAPASRWILTVVLIEGALAFGALAFIPSLLLGRHDVSLAMAGGIAAFYGLGGFLYTRLARRLLGRLGEAGLARLGGALLLAGFVSFAYAPALAWAPFACLLAGFGFYSLHNTLQTNATQMAPAARGTAMSLFACCLFIGQSLGVLGAAWMADHLSDRLIFLCAGGGLFLLALIVARHGPPPASDERVS